MGVWAYTPSLVVCFLFFFVYSHMTVNDLFWVNVRRAGLRALTVNLTLTCLTDMGLFLQALHRWPVSAVQIKAAATPR